MSLLKFTEHTSPVRFSIKFGISTFDVSGFFNSSNIFLIYKGARDESSFCMLSLNQLKFKGSSTSFLFIRCNISSPLSSYQPITSLSTCNGFKSIHIKHQHHLRSSCMLFAHSSASMTLSFFVSILPNIKSHYGMLKGSISFFMTSLNYALVSLPCSFTFIILSRRSKASQLVKRFLTMQSLMCLMPI